MATFNLRASDSSKGGPIEPLVINAVIQAETVEEAIDQARAHPVNYYIGGGNHAWLVDETGAVVWSIKIKEGPDA